MLQTALRLYENKLSFMQVIGKQCKLVNDFSERTGAAGLENGLYAAIHPSTWLEQLLVGSSSIQLLGVIGVELNGIAHHAGNNLCIETWI